MNDLPLYESQIAAKLEQLPLPDMADAIWLRIKDQLDTDMPDNGGGHTSSPPPPPVSPIRPHRSSRAGLAFVVLVAIVTVVWLLPKQHKQQLPVAPPAKDSASIDNGQVVTPLPQLVTKPPAGNRPGQIMPAPQRQDSALPLVAPDNKLPAVVPVVDSTLPLPPPQLPLPSQGVNKAPQKTKDSIPPKKLSRGMPGITDSDYKIVPRPRE